MKLNRTANAKRNLIFGLIQKFVLILLPFFLRTTIIYVLGMQYLGLNSLFSAVLSALSVAELGFGSALVYSMYKPIAEDDISKVCALLNFYKKCYRIIGLLILSIGIMIMPFLRLLVKDSVPPNINIYIIYGVSLLNVTITYFLFSYKASLLTAFQRIDVSAKINTILVTLQYIVQIIVLITFKNYYLFIGVIFFIVIINNLWISSVVTKMFPEYKPFGKLEEQDYKLIKDKVKGLVAYKVGNIVSNSVDTIVISAFLGLEMVAIYGNYYYILVSLFGILSLYYNSIGGGLGNSIASETVETNYKLFNELFFVQNWIIGWMSICLLCLVQPFIELWVGEALLLPMGVVICLAIYFYSWKINDVVHIFKEAAGMWDRDRFRPLISSTVNLLINLLLVNIIGIYGIVISTIVCEFLFSLTWASLILYKDYFRISVFEYYKQIFSNLVLVLIIAIITYGICSFFIFEGIILLAIRSVICLIIPNILFLFVFHFTKKDVILFRIIKKVISKV